MKKLESKTSSSVLSPRSAISHWINLYRFFNLSSLNFEVVVKRKKCSTSKILTKIEILFPPQTAHLCGARFSSDTLTKTTYHKRLKQEADIRIQSSLRQTCKS